MNRTVSVVAVALLVVLAGCAGGGSSSATTTEPAGGGSPDGDTTNGSSNAGDVTFVDDRAAALEAAGSFTSVWQMRSTRGDESNEMAYVTKLDYQNERYNFVVLSTSDGVTVNTAENFYADGTSYQRFGEGSDAQYSSNSMNFSNIAPSGQVGFVASSQDLSDFSYAGTETFDGVTVKRYEMSKAATWLAGQGGSDGDVQWTDFSYVVLVDANGLVRSEHWTGKGVTDDSVDVSIEYTYELTDVGSTAIPDPSWLGNVTTTSQ